MVWALFASNRCPLNAISLACPFPTTLGRRCKPPTSVIKPNFASGKANRVSWEQSLISQQRTSSSPAPRQCPWIRAMVGFEIRSSRVWISWVFLTSLKNQTFCVAFGVLFIAENSSFSGLRSRPAQNDSPSPLRRTTLASGSSSAIPMAMSRAFHTTGFKAFRFSGLFKVITPMCSSLW